MPNNVDLYANLYKIRRFEETVLENFPKGVFFGTTHTYLGQEADAAGVLSHLRPGDVVFSNHRCHGHFMAYGGDPRALFAELMGKATGVSGGRGGSQHLHWRNFYSNGVQGGIAPIAAGMALAEKRLGSGALAVAFIGDGTLGEGTLYEALNLASLWQAPILYVLEDNRIAQTTPVELAVAGEMAARFQAFGIPTCELDTSDVLEILPAAGDLLEQVRRTQTPRALILHTCRFGPHSKGDDTRPEEEVARMRRERDPLAIHAARLGSDERGEVEARVDAEIAEAFRLAREDPFPVGADLRVRPLRTSPPPTHPAENQPSAQRAGARSVLHSINAGLQAALEQDEHVVMLGEDVLDPYGGAFKATRGLSQAFPERVLTTPISEAGITGLGAGMALRGLRPVVEIMFGDFLTLAADQIINHAAKFRGMYAGSQDGRPAVPLVIRTPMGGRRGYGPTHSQTLEKHFLGVPGLHVLAPCALEDPGGLLLDAILHTQDPVMFIENKLLYLLPVQPLENDELDIAVDDDRPDGAEVAVRAPTYTLRVRGAPPATLTLAAYGYMAELARQALLRLAYEHEVFCELVVPTRLAPFASGALIASARRTGRLVAVEEGTLSLGWGAEALARVAEALGGGLRFARRVAAAELPIPASGLLEAATLPAVETILEACLHQ